MAATKRNAMWIEETRKKIQTSQLLNRLHNHVVGKVEMQNSQVKAAQILLDKSLPNLQAVAVTGEGFTGPVLIATGVPRAESD